jgi:hypothetical protein
MNPIPLRHKRRVYAWACGRCGKVGSGSSCGLGYDPAMVAEMVKANADNGKRYASRCCLCHDCEAVELVGETYGLCPTCQAKEDKRLAKVGAEWAASATAREAHNTAAIAAAGGDPDAAARLCEFMSDLSEFCWCSGWLSDCESQLWAFVTDGPGEWGLQNVDQRDIDELRHLSDKAGGWWTWSNALDGNTFVPMAEWLARCGQGAAPVPDPSPEGGKVGA